MSKLFDESGTFSLSIAGGYYALIMQGDDNFLWRCECLCVNTGILFQGKIQRLPNNILYLLAPLERIKAGFQQYFKWELIQEKSSEIGYNNGITADEEEKLVESGMSEEEANELWMPSWNEYMLERVSGELMEKFFEQKVLLSTMRNEVEEGSFYSDLTYNLGNTKEFAEYDEVESSDIEKKKLNEEVETKLRITL